MPREFLADEIDRYVVMPGQALAYLTGKLEPLRIREDARKRLGSAFSLPAFHGAVLDHGSLPMPTLARSITGWLDGAVTPPHLFSGPPGQRSGSAYDDRYDATCTGWVSGHYRAGTARHDR